MACGTSAAFSGNTQMRYGTRKLTRRQFIRAIRAAGRETRTGRGGTTHIRIMDTPIADTGRDAFLIAPESTARAVAGPHVEEGRRT